jgi:hypothetical protein
LANEQEATTAQLLVSSTWLQPIAGLTLVFGLLVVLVAILVRGDQAILQDGVEIGFDVVGGNDVLVIFVVVRTGDRLTNRTLGPLVVIIVLVGEVTIEATELVVVEVIFFEVATFEIVLVEFGIVDLGVGLLQLAIELFAVDHLVVFVSHASVLFVFVFRAPLARRDTTALSRQTT